VTALHWATAYAAEGNAYGFTVHNREARAAFERAGGGLDEASPVALQVLSPLGFEPVPGKYNVLYTAWESWDIPERIAQRARRADMILTASEFLVGPFGNACPGVPVYACPLGVDVEAFPFVKRWLRPGGTFRWLWVGAPNARKGWELALRAFLALRDQGQGLPPMELYIKTTVSHKQVSIAGVTFDSRDLSRGELNELYASAHAFIFPSFGEGFGLTLAEALATGLPAVYTDWSAQAELAGGPGFGYPVPYNIIQADYGLGETIAAAHARPADLLSAMMRLMMCYKAALQKGRAASFRIRKEFTWDLTGERLVRFARLAHETEKGRGNGGKR